MLDTDYSKDLPGTHEWCQTVGQSVTVQGETKRLKIGMGIGPAIKTLPYWSA